MAGFIDQRTDCERRTGSHNRSTGGASGAVLRRQDRLPNGSVNAPLRKLRLGECLEHSMSLGQDA